MTNLPAQFSGGRTVSVCWRARLTGVLMCLFADEPTANPDRQTGDKPTCCFANRRARHHAIR
ncbi:hypothetical protein KCP73_05220 [Salmonella enterica subsp. enterica]|nr:hypothetical protein KCP73_05220 [Salmonella enterica subsp. enterica]